MGTVIAVGPAVQVAGWALAGADVRPAETDEQAQQVWGALPSDVSLLVVAESVSRAVHDRPLPPGALTVVLPE